MTRTKNFGSGPDLSKIEPISFTLHNEEFQCIPQVQGKILLRIVEDSQSEDTAKSAAIITTFFAHVLTDEAYERFNTLLESKDKIVEVETLAEITGWLVEEYTNRPEAPAED